MPSTPLQERRTVLQILESFQGLTPLRELLAQLNYEPINDPIPRTGWKEDERALLAADPRVLGNAAGDFNVIYAQLACNELRRTEQRPIIAQLLKQYPYSLFVFSNTPQNEFHFVNVKWETGSKRRVFRRIAVGRHERLRTAVERISMLDVETIQTGLFGLTAQQVQDRHDEAFDVSEVTKDFYRGYTRAFEAMRASIKGFGSSQEEQERKHLFTQRLFNRLMFLRFIQKKGWLTLDGNPDYLAALWSSHRKLRQDGKNFFDDRLKLLFAALDDERASGILLSGGGGAIEKTIGKVKYLNGGLFEPKPEDLDPRVKIPDASFSEIFDREKGLFERFNFTITESTPLDEEIAVDPEMLGKIFEELVTGRHESGSYYTPKPIVSFMCREALKGYLETQVATEKKDALARFVDKHEPDEIHDAEAVLNALRRVTVCDPACGSGAYLLGMMHELLDLRQCLFQTRKVDNRTMYQRKLDIIQSNIYGVDIAEFAVNIARLRLWLALAVDYDGPEPQPLPNLDYKIEVGDTVCSPSPAALQMGLQQPLVDQFLEVKGRYLLAHHAEKSLLRAQIDELKKQIIGFSHRDAGEFDWVIDFAEVFTCGGFDVVIANPPYISALEFSRKYPKEYRAKITSLFRSTKKAYDIYIPFFERAIELLKMYGHLAFITPNKYLSAPYGIALREYFVATTELIGIIDLSSVEVFTSVSVYPVITLARRVDQPVAAFVWTLKPRVPGNDDPAEYKKVVFESSLLTLLPETIWGFLLSDNVALLRKLLNGTQPLSSFGWVKATSTAAEAEQYAEFLSDTETADSKRFVNTGTIDVLESLWGRRRLRECGRTFDTPFLDLTAADVSAGRRELYTSPKVIFAKIGKVCEAFYDATGEYASTNTNCFYSPLKDRDLVPIVAAYSATKLFMFFYVQFFGALRMSGGYLQFQAPQLRVIPFRAPEGKLRDELLALMDLPGDEWTKNRPTFIQRIDEIFAVSFEISDGDRHIIGLSK